MEQNEPCSLQSQCLELRKGLDKRLIGIADARLYNLRFGLARPVAYGLFKALRFYRRAVKDICEGNTCEGCYGFNLEDILEKSRIIIN